MIGETINGDIILDLVLQRPIYLFVTVRAAEKLEMGRDGACMILNASDDGIKQFTPHISPADTGDNQFICR